MEQGTRKKYKVVVTLLVVIIVILLALVVLLATGTISFKFDNIDNNQSSENTIDNLNNEETNDNIIDNSSNEKTNEYTIASETSIKIDLNWDNDFLDIKVVDGKLQIKEKTFVITNERIKYFYLQRYQSSSSAVFYYLTEQGNVYVTIFSEGDNIDESFNNFIKLDYSNVSDIVLLPNPHYGKAYDEVSGLVDYKETFLCALINGETFLLDYQYNY